MTKSKINIDKLIGNIHIDAAAELYLSEVKKNDLMSDFEKDIDVKRQFISEMIKQNLIIDNHINTDIVHKAIFETKKIKDSYLKKPST